VVTPETEEVRREALKSVLSPIQEMLSQRGTPVFTTFRATFTGMTSEMLDGFNATPIEGLEMDN
jgi:hypothetical protein